ncbi:MAG: phosphate-selective porin O and P [Proteobacteria bacterium]|nr:phosphate-selective porin O and P [Pseudomonadota bacterium]
MNHKKKLLVKAIGVGLLTCASAAQAANWLMLQGTEKDGQSARAKLWGFVQVQYQNDRSSANSGDGYIPPKLIGPNLNSQSAFNVNRARIGVRGTGFPLDNKVNYFFLAEFGNNGITAPGDRNVRITDASITLNHIPGARVRAGLFKTPGAEEGLQAIHVFDYINFTTVTNQLLLERFPNSNGSYDAAINNAPIGLPSPTGIGAFDSSVGAFRDTGIQVFDTFKVDNWEHSYAVMYGNGNGLNFGNGDGHYDTYLYWSSELVFGGKGGRRQGLKMFAWGQSGKRLLDTTNDTTYNPESYDRDRSGLGFKYLQKPFRVSAEYMQGKGMIFVGQDKATFDINPAVAGGNGEEGKANGYYLEGGWYIPNSKWEIDLRYDIYNRLTDDTPFPAGAPPAVAGKTFEMNFQTITLGAQYHINKKTRINMEVSDRTFEAVDWDSGAGPNANLDGVSQRYAIQLTHVF